MQVIDSNAVDNFLRMARSVGLLGAQCMLTGIDPKLAQTMVSLGVDLSSIITFRTLRAALDRIAGVPDHGSA